jgi:hypothetical protein
VETHHLRIALSGCFRKKAETRWLASASPIFGQRYSVQHVFLALL